MGAHVKPHVHRFADGTHLGVWGNYDLLMDEQGQPEEGAFANAIQVWIACQNRSEAVSVSEVAQVFNATPDVVRLAIEAHPWMFLDDDDTIAEEGV